MRKVLTFMLAAAAFGAFTAPAQKTDEKKTEEEQPLVIVLEQGGDGNQDPNLEMLPPLSDWTFFQLGFLPGVPGATQYSNVYGGKAGAPMCDGYGRVYGAEGSFFYSGTSYIKGIQASWFGPAIAREIDGFQASCSFTMNKQVRGMQAAPVSIGKDLKGVQLGAVNYAEPCYGFQGGGVNIADKCVGLQFGFLNYSKSDACQVGVINIIEDSLLPFCPFVNVSF